MDMKNELPERKNFKSSFLCPICKKPMTIINGTEVSPTNGVTIYCDTPYGKGLNQCKAQEVVGHGKNEKHAYEIVIQKYE